jgi:hypothetical protein
VRFASVVRLRKDGLVCGSWLKRRIASPRLTKIEHLERADWIYEFVLRSPRGARRRGSRVAARGLRRGATDTHRPVSAFRTPRARRSGPASR